MLSTALATPADAVVGPLLAVCDVTKRFGGNVAVSDVSFDLEPGELVGLIGPNGAGKSTILHLISGRHRPTSGSILFQGHDIGRLRAPAVARLGIARANQIPQPFARLTVRENLLVAGHSVAGKHSLRVAHVDDVLEQCGLDRLARRLAGSLTLLDLKRLEVARALALHPRLLLLDEVAAGLIGREVDEITGLIARIAGSGVTVLLVEHVQSLVRALAQRVLVLDWGRLVAEGTPDEVAADPEVVRIYLGTGAAELIAREPSPVVKEARPVLSVQGLTVDYGRLRAVHTVDIEVAEGQIVALLGANGAGKSSIARSIAGIVPTSAGRLWLCGEEITSLSAHRRARRGLAICHEGRRLFTQMTVRENLELACQYSRGGRKQMASRLARVTDVFPVLSERFDTAAGALSGGQQQMVAIGRALMSEPRVVILDELSLGLSPVAIDEIYKMMGTIRDAGVSVLLVEQNAYRSLAVADHVYVLERGQVALSASPAEVQRDDSLRAAYFGEQGRTNS